MPASLPRLWLHEPCEPRGLARPERDSPIIVRQDHPIPIAVGRVLATENAIIDDREMNLVVELATQGARAGLVEGLDRSGDKRSEVPQGLAQ